jgi:hypothetical protein
VCLSFLGIPALYRRIISASSPCRPLVLHPWMPSIHGSWTAASTVSIRQSAVSPMVGPNFLSVMDRREGYLFPCVYSLMRLSNSGFVSGTVRLRTRWFDTFLCNRVVVSSRHASASATFRATALETSTTVCAPIRCTLSMLQRRESAPHFSGQYHAEAQ